MRYRLGRGGAVGRDRGLTPGRGVGVGLGVSVGVGVSVAVAVAVAVGVDVEVAVAVAVAVGVKVVVAVAVAVEVAVAVAVAVGVGVEVGVAVAVAVGVGVPPLGPWITTFMNSPVLKKPTDAIGTVSGGVSASNRKLYNVPQRIALAFWFCANVSALHRMVASC